MEWARALLGETDFSLLEAPATPETSKELFFFPYLAGATSPYWQGEARGVVRGLSLATSRQDFLAAVVRGICYELRANLEAIEAIMAADSSTVAETTLNGATAKRPPVILKEIAVFGGGSKSRYWLQTLTAVLGRPLVHILHPDLPGIGACLLAGRGIGLFPELAMPKPDSLGDGILAPTAAEVEREEGFYQEYQSYRKAYFS